LIAEAERELAALSHDRKSSPVPAVEFPAALSAREVDVLRLVAQGLPSAEIAERLFISVRTVNTHLTNIYRKLGTSSRAAAIRFALDNDLV
jgi:DNA-binding NarL/FixJ family response regulator